MIAKHLIGAGIRFERIDGRTKPAQRQEVIDSFNGSGLAPVLIMTTGTGAFGYVKIIQLGCRMVIK